MRRLSWRRSVPAAVVVVMVSAVASSAITSAGYHSRHVSEDDASIWTAQGSSADPSNPGSFVGRANTLAGVIDTALVATSRPQLLQNGAHVVFHDAASGSVQSIDSTLGTLGAALTVPPLKAPTGTVAAGTAITGDDQGMPAVDLNRAGEVALGGDTVAVVDQAAGKLYVLAADALPSGPLATQTANAKVAVGSQVAVDVDGGVHVVSPAGAVTDYASRGQLVRHSSLGADLGKASTPGSPFSLTTVGDRVIAMDGNGGIYAEGHTGQVGSADGGSGAVLQQSGVARPGVVFETTGSLATMNLATGAVTVLSTVGRGAPTAPVFVGERGCTYGAWAGSAAVPADASTTGSPAVGPMIAAICDSGTRYQGPGLPNPQWRANHGSAMLNDELSGNNLFFDGLVPEHIDDWSQAQRTTKGSQTISTTTTTISAQQAEPPSPIDHPPVAVDDMLATRPGVPLIAHVLANDTDPDSDELAVTGLTDLPAADSGARVTIVDGGDAVQVTPAGQGLAPVSFGYSIDDGRGLSSAAHVTVAIHPLTENSPPVIPTNEQAVVVAAGGRITVDLLRDVTDPDGDPLTLSAVKLPAGAGSAEFTAAGLAIVSPTAAGSVPVSFSVSDGRGGVTTGTQLLDVRAPGTPIAPQANNDHLQVTQGVPGTIDVFANDVSGSGQPLSLVSVDNPAGLSIEQLGGGVLSISASAVGTTLVHYVATDGSQQASAVVRVDSVQAAAKTVTAVRDDATLRPGQATVIPVLDNDIDTSGNILLIDGVTGVPPGLSVSQTGHAALTVTTQQPLTQPETFSYTASDGVASDVGTVVVRPAPGGVDQPPVTVPLSVEVRAGNAIPIDPLARDFDPEGEALTLTSVAPLAAGQGTIFTEAGQLRYVAPDVAVGSVAASYVVKDSAGNATTGTVSIHVLPVASTNHPPDPPTVTARVYANQSVTVLLPLLGIDPDGDVTTLVGVSQGNGALLGSITSTGAEEFVFTAGGSGGTQALSYQVRDSGGLLATGAIDIGIAAAPAENSPPVALPDTVSIAPGALRRVAVLANDSDPDGDPLHLDAGSLTQPGGGSVTIDGSYLDVTAPATAAEGKVLSFAYGIDDGRGGTATSTVTETVTAHPPLKPPVAVDDVATAQKPGSTVRVNVLANDTIVNGTPAQATLTAPNGPGVTAAPGGFLTFVMPAHPVSFSYTVTDAAAQSASAVVSVPLAQGLPPVTSPDAATTKAGAPVSLNVLANDHDPAGAALTVAKIGSSSGGTAAVTGAGVVRFSPAAGFSGLGGFTYVVSNGQQTATGTATITVLGGAEHPPTVSLLTVALTPGHTSSLDLRNAVTDSDPGAKLSYSGLQGANARVKAELSGTRVDISVPAGTGPGTVPLTYTVSDGHPRGAATGNIQVIISGGVSPGSVPSRAPVGQGASPPPTALASPKPSPVSTAVAAPAPQALTDSASTLQEHPVTIDVLANDVDPLGKGLHLVSVAGGGADGSSNTSGQSVTFTPAAGFHGLVSLSYVMADSAARQATGAIMVTVIGRPDAPGLPGGSAQSHQVMLSWTVPSSNGGTISGYQVSWNGGSQACPANSCTITGLTNGKTYTFTVTATDEAGTGPASAASQPIDVDEIPGVPQAPTATPGNTQVSLTWPVPQSGGSAVTSYTVVQSPGGSKMTVTSPSATFTGLTNGSSYTYTVDATNRAGTSDYSAASAPATPAGPPPTPAAPSATNTQGSNSVTVTWGAANDNGAAINYYTLQVIQDGAVSQTLKESDPSNRSTTVAVSSGHSYAFTISATNSVGTSAYSGQSNTLTPSGTPDKVGTVTAAYFCCKLSNVKWSAPADNGSAITHWVIDDNQGHSYQDSSASPDANEPTDFGTTYTFTVQGCNANGCGPFSDPSAPETPSSTPGVSGVTGTAHKNSTTTWYVSYTWTNNDSGSPITSTDLAETRNGNDGTTKTTKSMTSGTTYNSGNIPCNNSTVSYTDSLVVTVHNSNGSGTNTSQDIAAAC